MFGLAMGVGAALALTLCVQNVQTYFYASSVLVPQQAEREAELQAGLLASAARHAGITEPNSLDGTIAQLLESEPNRVLWIRVLDINGKVLAQGGDPTGTPHIPADLLERIEKHEPLGKRIATPRGDAIDAIEPFRMPRPQASELQRQPTPRPPFLRRGGGLVAEVAIPVSAVSGNFSGLHRHLIIGLIAAIALLISVTLIGLQAPQYLRGKHLEGEMELARRVQQDLQPLPHAISPHLEFASSAIAADQVGGDFHDVFETGSGKVAIVLGDVSGKGISAALLASVIQGAIRSATAEDHETAVEQTNRMLCERTSCERFATLFWGVFDPETRLLRYVNAGHTAPMLIRNGLSQCLSEGGPVLGILPTARYSAGVVFVEGADTLILYSDGINEAANNDQEEFGDARIERISIDAADCAPAEICARILNQVTKFSSTHLPADDRTLLIARFPGARAAEKMAYQASEAPVAA